jgi:hypothetical protein
LIARYLTGAGCEITDSYGSRIGGSILNIGRSRNR